MIDRKVLLLAGTFLVLFLMGIVVMRYLQGALQGTTMTLGVDLYPRWIGSQAALAGQSPYSLQTRRQVWTAIYGSPAVPQGNPFGFYYPPSVVTLIAPFLWAGLSLPAAAVLWCALIWSLWLVCLLLYARGLGRQRFVLPLLLVSGIFFRPAFSNYLLGQFALFSVLLLIGAWLAARSGHEVLAGILAALASIKISILLVPLALWLLLNIRRFKTVLAGALTLLLLFLPPTLWLGWWLPDWIRDLSAYATENAVSWSLADIFSWTGLVWLLAAGVLLGLGLYRKDLELALAASLALGGVFGPHTADYDLVIFVGLLGWLGYHWLRQQRSLWLAALFLAVLWLPWISLLVFLSQHLSVESWYRFIWLSYPPVILLLAGAEALRTHGPLTRPAAVAPS